MPLFKTPQSHICTINEPTRDFMFSERMVRSKKKWKRKAYPKIWRWTTLWEYNPKTIEFYRSEIEMKQKRLEHISSYYWIIHPFSKFRSFYEIWMAVVLTIQLLYIPMNLSFNLIIVHQEAFRKSAPQSYNAGVHHFFYVTKWFTLIDVVINFLTGYVNHNRVILKPRKIALHYLFSVYFITDILSSLPYLPRKLMNLKDIVLESFQVLKIFRVFTCITYISRAGDLFAIERKWFDIVFFFVMLIVGLHWYACVLFFVPQIRVYLYGVLDEKSWLVKEHGLLNSVTTQYVYNFYVATTYVFCIYINNPLTGVEQIEEAPFPPWEEQMTMIFYYTSGRILMSLLIVFLMHIFLSMRNLENKYEQVMTQVSMFMRQQKLPMDMQKKVCTFYQYKYNRNYFKDTVVDDILSTTLRSEIRYHECSSMITNVTLFSNLPSFILGKILQELVPEIFLAEDIILRHGGVGDCMYFLASGTVAVYTPAGKEICHLQDGAHFGEVALVLKGKKRTATIKAVEICELYRLDKKAFKACFVKNTEIFEQLQQTAMQRTENTDKIDVEFESADKKNEFEQHSSIG